ncbi:serum paraoxonase/arylesterase 2-like [Rhinophrynus dorsalis]
MGKLLRITLIGVLLAFTGERIMKFGHRLNFYREVEHLEFPHCQLIKGIELGSEDIDILPNGLAFISSGLKYPGMINFQPERPGEIFLLDLNDKQLQPVSLRFSRGFELSTFNPHGISTYIDEKDDTVYLFVVNHPKFKSTIEIFKFEEEENVLIHLKTIKHDLLPNVNDIVAVGPESFYATNDFYFSDYTLRHLEMLLGIAWSNVVYYSPNKVNQVASGYYYANGVAMSTDKRYIYVNDVLGHTLNVLEKHADWSLTPIKVLELEILVDNLYVDPNTGDIWTAGIPNGWKIISYNLEDPPGSEVLRVQNIHSDNPIVTQVYVNNGSVIQASSSAAVYERKLLVGTIFHKALYCEL